MVGFIYTAFSVTTPSGPPGLLSNDAIPTVFDITFVVAMVALQVSAVTTLVVGFPIYRYLVRQKLLSAASGVVVGGAISGSGLLFAARRLNDFLVSVDFNMAAAAIIARRTSVWIGTLAGSPILIDDNWISGL